MYNCEEAGGLLLDANLNPLDADLSYETRVSFIAATNQKFLMKLCHKLIKILIRSDL